MTGAGTIAVFADFDDTLTMQNVAQFLLRRFAPEALAENRKRFRKGEITFREYQELSFDAVSTPVTEMQAVAANEIEMRDGIPELMQAITKAGGTLTVASAGLHFYIDPVLERHGLGNLPVVCGTATRTESTGQAVSGPFRYDYPFTGENDEPCRGDWATCKCRALEQAGDGATTVFVGDGSTSDACVAPRADFVFARDRLLDICNRDGINARPFEDLRTVAEFVNELHAAQLARSEQK